VRQLPRNFHSLCPLCRKGREQFSELQSSEAPQMALFFFFFFFLNTRSIYTVTKRFYNLGDVKKEKQNLHIINYALRNAPCTMFNCATGKQRRHILKGGGWRGTEHDRSNKCTISRACLSYFSKVFRLTFFSPEAYNEYK